MDKRRNQKCFGQTSGVMRFGKKSFHQRAFGPSVSIKRKKRVEPVFETKTEIKTENKTEEEKTPEIPDNLKMNLLRLSKSIRGKKQKDPAQKLFDSVK